MSISITEYVDITSGVGAGNTVAQRELIMRLFTTNAAIPAGSVVEVTTLEDVESLFGTDSDEYRRAVKYFGFVSKSVTSPKKLSFAHYAETAESPSIMGTLPTTQLTAWQAIEDGAFTLQVGTQGADLTNLDFSGVTSLADVAGVIQTGIRAAAGSNFATATVTYDNVAQKFMAQFPDVTAVPAAVTVSAPTSGTSIVNAVGWGTGATFGSGATAQSPLEAVTAADVISDNYGTFGFIEELTLDEWAEIGAWVQAANVKYMALVPVTYDERADWYARLGTFGGVALTLVNDVNNEHDEDVPGILVASTDYTKRNTAKNFMFQQISGLSPKVTDTAVSQALNELRINYYGQTQTAGQNISFYQRGYLCGTASTPSQMGVFANEMWFKSAATSNLMSLLLSLEIIPATDEGRAMVLASLQDVIDRALFNGTIVTGKDLTITQRLYINQITDDELAWHQVESIGYWIDAVVTQTTNKAGVTEYQIDYTLIYSKADAVNKITGRDILI